MNISKIVKYKGKWIPLVSTPISKNELFHLQQNHKEFLIHDCNNGKISFMDSNSQNINYSFDLGFRTMVRFTGLVFVIYNLFSLKKKISQKIPFGKENRKATKEFIDSLNSIKMPGKTDDQKKTNPTFDFN